MIATANKKRKKKKKIGKIERSVRGRGGGERKGEERCKIFFVEIQTALALHQSENIGSRSLFFYFFYFFLHLDEFKFYIQKLINLSTKKNST